MGRYVRGVVREWRARFNERVEIVLLVPEIWPAIVAGNLREQLGDANMAVVNRRFAARHADVVWYPWNGIAWQGPATSVVTMHDLWPFASPNASKRLRLREQTPYRRAAQRASRIIAVSHFTMTEAIKYLDVAPERIAVVLEGVAPLAPIDSGSAAIDGRYVLFVGENDPRKQLATLVDAMAALPAALRESIALVAAGRGTQEMSAPSGTRLHALGEVPDARLAALYSHAAVFAFPSRYEGFGLPLLEAMSYGAPVVASDAASIPEVCGSAALFFPSGDAGALSASLARVLTDDALANSLRAAGKARAAETTVTRCAEQTLSVLEQAILESENACANVATDL